MSFVSTPADRSSFVYVIPDKTLLLPWHHSDWLWLIVSVTWLNSITSKTSKLSTNFYCRQAFVWVRSVDNISVVNFFHKKSKVTPKIYVRLFNIPVVLPFLEAVFQHISITDKEKVRPVSFRSTYAVPQRAKSTLKSNWKSKANRQQHEWAPCLVRLYSPVDRRTNHSTPCRDSRFMQPPTIRTDDEFTEVVWKHYSAGLTPTPQQNKHTFSPVLSTGGDMKPRRQQVSSKKSKKKNECHVCVTFS